MNQSRLKKGREKAFRNNSPKKKPRLDLLLHLVIVARPSIFVGTPSILESLRLKQIYLYCKTIIAHVLHID